MANIQLFDLARMTVSSTGTGATITLNAAVSGFNTFDAAGCSTAATGQTLTYAINDTTQSEIGPGTYYSSSVQLTRASSTTGLHSTNGNSRIDMSNTAQVFITPSAANLGLTGQIPGTTTNDNASSGNVGEYTQTVVSSGASITIPNGSPADITSVTLTPGDWDVWGTLAVSGTLATLTGIHVWVSSQSATIPVSGGPSDALLQLPFGTGNQYVPSGVRRFTTANSTTAYLSAVVQGSSGISWGTIAARRVR